MIAPLQLDRQRAHRHPDIAEAFAGVGPPALPRMGQRPPERRVVLVADERIGEILERLLGALAA